MITTNNNIGSALESSAGIHTLFSQYGTELDWLAYFLTGDEKVAAACVADAGALSVSHNQIFNEWLSRYARRATIRTAIQIQRTRIAQLTSIYDRRSSSDGDYPPLSRDALELVLEETTALVTRLDVLCRCALVMCGIEQRQLHEAASLLGVNKTIVRAAYSTALEHLEVICCQRFTERNESAAVCN